MLLYVAAHATWHIACAHVSLRVSSTTFHSKNYDMLLHAAAHATWHIGCAYVGLRAVSTTASQ